MPQDDKTIREELDEAMEGRTAGGILQPFWEELKYQLRRLFGKA